MNLDDLLSIAAPHNCVSCGQEGALLCSPCIEAEIEPVVPACYKCNESTPFFTTCASCRRSSFLKQVWVCTEYEDAVRELIHMLKFERVKAASKELSYILDNFAPQIDDAIITFVPTASVRKRRRGYDHGALIATDLAKKRGLRHFQLLSRLNQHSQVGSSRRNRKANVTGAFRPVNKAVINGANIILVDDVVSTGATLDECAATLYAAGAAEVTALVVAKN